MGCTLSKLFHRSLVEDTRVSTETQLGKNFEPAPSPSSAFNTSSRNMRLPCVSTIPDLSKEIPSEKENLLHGIFKNDVEEVKTILDRAHFNIDEPLDSYGYTASHLAAHRDSRILQLLIAYGADINRQSNEDGLSDTPLHIAAMYGNKDSLKLLVDSGKADLSKVNISGMTPFNLAFLGKSLECVEILLNAGYDPNQELSPGVTPIMASVSLGDAKMTGILIDYGANVNVSYNSLTPLTIACLSENVEIVELLLKSGADPNPENVDQTPIQVSQEANNQTITDLLTSYDSQR